MGRSLAGKRRTHRAVAWLLATAALGAWAQQPAAPAASAVAAQGAASAPVENSNIDATLFYQLLIGEIELRAGEAGVAYEVLLDAARRTKDPALFRRAMDVALQARAGDQALAAVRAWRQALPNASDALQFQVQILIALNRPTEVVEPLRSWLAAAPAAERPAMITALPRAFARMPDRAKTAALLEQVLGPYRDAPDTRTAARVTLGRVQLAAGQGDQALALARAAHADDTKATGPVLLALELLATQSGAESIVTDYLAQPGSEAQLRLAYVRALTQPQLQRYADAAAQLEQFTRDQPQLAPPWLTLGALRLELKQPKEAEAAVQKYLSLAQNEGPETTTITPRDDDEPVTVTVGSDGGHTQAWLLLAQAAEQRGDLKAAEAWLAKIDNPQRALEVQTRRAVLLAKQGKVREARDLIHRVPERNAEDTRAKVLAEAQVLREVKRWRDAQEVLAEANKRMPDDADLLYEQAMVEDRLERHAEMERLLKRVMTLKPDHSHAHNALGYSLADRNLRLPEAKALIQKALELSPGDPFITDSLGWVEYRMGNREEALRLLRLAYATRPDVEIAAHLGEVMWASGQRDEARRIWLQARGRDAANDVLRETLARLKVSL